jgi:predicted RNA methylase
MMHQKPIAAGKSSFNLIDAGKLFSELSLAKGAALLDLACGSGAYAIAASREIGGQGRIYAVDLWKGGIAALRKEAAGKGSRTSAPSLPMSANISRSRTLPSMFASQPRYCMTLWRMGPTRGRCRS